MVTALELLKTEIQNARETFTGTMADIAPEHLHLDPGGKALPLSALYAHLILSEDMTIQTFLQGKQPLYETTFKDKSGVTPLMPPMDEHWAEAHEKWAKSVKIDMQQFSQYEKAVYAATDQYLASISNEDLEKEVDMGAWGKKTVMYLLYAFIIGHTFSLTGEASAIKGVHGTKGYTF